MLNTDIPTKFPVRWANSAVVGTGVRPIPSAPSTQPGAASLETGFPPLNFIADDAGGIPPFGQDMNGILQRITAWSRWHAAGAPIAYDASYATAIGGYPAASLLISNSGHAWYENLVNNNTTDPNTGGANWKIAYSIWSTGIWVAGGSANAQLVSFTPGATSLPQLHGIPFTFKSVGTNTSAVTLNVNALGAVQITASNGTLLSANALVSGSVYQVIYDSSANAFRLISHIPVFTDVTNAGVSIVGTAANGANIALQGNGGTTPNKFLRAAAGAFQIINSAYTTAIASFTDGGNLTTAGSITSSSGDILANAGKLRATVGAFGSSDPAAATILNDFKFVSAGTQPSAFGYRQDPDGFLLQWGVGTIAPGTSIVNVTFPLAFPASPLSVMVNEIAPASWLIAGRVTAYAANVLNNSQAQIIGLIWNPGTTSWTASDPASVGISFRYWAIGK